MKKYAIQVFLLIAAVSLEGQTLNDYFMEAAQSNPGLLSKYKEFEASLERIQQTNSLKDPTLSFGYFISPIETRVGPQRARLSLTQMFPWFGTLKTNGDISALNAEAKYQSFMDSRNKLYLELASVYYPLYEINKSISLEQENLTFLSTYKNISTKKFENGEGALVDVLRVDLMLKQAETEIEILTKEKLIYKAQFNSLINRNLAEEIEIPETLEISSAIQPTDSGYVTNPLVKEMDMRIEASTKQTLLAQKKGLPNIGVGIDYLIVGERTDIAPGAIRQTDDGKDALMPMLTVSLPIFRSKYNAAKKEAQLLKKSYILERENRINKLSSNYAMTNHEASQQEALIKLYDEQIEETKQVLNLLLSGYQNSGDNFEELLKTEQLLIKYKKQKAAALIKNRIAAARLKYLSGNIPIEK